MYMYMYMHNLCIHIHMHIMCHYYATTMHIHTCTPYRELFCVPIGTCMND